jgi:hypothetical protein
VTWPSSPVIEPPSVTSGTAPRPGPAKGPLLCARELERLLGRKTLESEILKEALELGERRLDCRGLQPGMAASSCSAFQFQGSSRASSMALVDSVRSATAAPGRRVCYACL